MGNNFRKTLNKDADFVKVQKEINALNKDMEKLRKNLTLEFQSSFQK